MKSTGSNARWHHCCPAVRPWGSHVPFLSLSLLVCRMEIIIVPPGWVNYESSLRKYFRALRTGLGTSRSVNVTFIITVPCGSSTVPASVSGFSPENDDNKGLSGLVTQRPPGEGRAGITGALRGQMTCCVTGSLRSTRPPFPQPGT